MSTKETIEQAAEHYAHNWFNMHDTNNYKALRDGFIAGVEWEDERRYQIIDEYVNDIMGGCNLSAKEWFEKFKKQ
jgi:hypothetical protein